MKACRLFSALLHLVQDRNSCHGDSDTECMWQACSEQLLLIPWTLHPCECDGLNLWEEVKALVWKESSWNPSHEWECSFVGRICKVLPLREQVYSLVGRWFCKQGWVSCGSWGPALVCSWQSLRDLCGAYTHKRLTIAMQQARAKWLESSGSPRCFILGRWKESRSITSLPEGQKGRSVQRGNFSSKAENESEHYT